MAAATTRMWISPNSAILHDQKPAVLVSAKRPSCTSTRTRRPIIVAHGTTTTTTPALQTTPLQLQIRSNSIKVFEDRSSGIVCYRDDKGEITCEGYDDDEGPRFHHHHHHHHHHRHPFSSFSCSIQRDAEVIDLLHRRLLQIVEDANHR